MMPLLKMTPLLALLVTGSAILCPPGRGCAPDAVSPGDERIAQAADTARVRLHISGMTCGSCPTTARLALTRLAGVYSATVTLGDSLGVVRYDSQRVSPRQIAEHLTRLTGYRATVLPDSSPAVRQPTRR